MRLTQEPATDAVDRYGRLLRYVIRVRDRLNVNVYLVRIGAAAPYFFDHRRGRYAWLLERLALRVGSLPTHPVRPLPWSLHETMSRRCHGDRRDKLVDTEPTRRK